MGAGIGAGIGYALQGTPIGEVIAKDGPVGLLGTGMQAAASNALTQTVSVKLGLQDSFQGRSVAAAGVGATVSRQVGNWTKAAQSALGHDPNSTASIWTRGFVASAAASVVRNQVYALPFNMTAVAAEAIGDVIREHAVRPVAAPTNAREAHAEGETRAATQHSQSAGIDLGQPGRGFMSEGRYLPITPSDASPARAPYDAERAQAVFEQKVSTGAGIPDDATDAQILARQLERSGLDGELTPAGKRSASLDAFTIRRAIEAYRRAEISTRNQTGGEYRGLNVERAGEAFDRALAERFRTEAPTLATRALGALQFAGGVGEFALGGTLGVTTGWTGVGALAGGSLMVLGADQASTGLQTLLSGTSKDSVLSSLAQSALGLDTRQANLLDASINITATAGGAGLVQAARGLPVYLDGSFAAREGASFADEAKLASHFEKHGAEFGALSADEYLQVGRDIIQHGQKVEYFYKAAGETRTGYVHFMGNTSRGEAKFGFVGTNAEGAITTIHIESGKSFWKMLNGNSADKTIRPAP